MKAFTFFNSLDEKIWGEDLETNSHFASLSIILAALFAAVAVASGAINEFFNAAINISLKGMALTCLFPVIIFNVVESIMSARTVKVAVLRSLFMIVVLATAFGLGFVGGVVVVGIILLVLLVVFVIALIKVFFSLLLGMDGSSGGGRKSRGFGLGTNDDGRESLVDEHGMEHTGHSNLSGDVFKSDRGETFVKDGMGSRGWTKVED